MELDTDEDTQPGATSESDFEDIQPDLENSQPDTEDIQPGTTGECSAAGTGCQTRL